MTASCNYRTKEAYAQRVGGTLTDGKGDPMFMKIMLKRIWNVFTIIGENEAKFDLVRN